MNQPILRSPREKMAGWVHLPRFIDKIRLSQAGRLPADYQANFCKGFDGCWLEASCVNQSQFLEVVKNSKNDAEIEKWVKTTILKSPAEIEAFNQMVLNRGRNDDVRERFLQRKRESGFEHREDVQCFADLIDADEGRI